jgi:O-antigen/teichoic acid export membrane protein
VKRNTVITIVFSGLAILTITLTAAIVVLRWNNPEADTGELGTALLVIIAVLAMFFPRDGRPPHGADGKPLVEDERDEP